MCPYRTVRKSNHAIDAIDATHWSICAQVPPEAYGDVVDVGKGRRSYRPGRFLDPTKSFLVTLANDPSRGLLYCNRCDMKRKPARDGKGGYMCNVCRQTDFDMLTEPTGRWAI